MKSITLGRLAITGVIAPLFLGLASCGGSTPAQSSSSSRESSSASSQVTSSAVSSESTQSSAASSSEEKAKSFTFEAELTNLSNWFGAGFSSNPAGVMAICADKYGANASNGYFICDMYKKESFITFDVEASADIENVDLTLRATAEKGIASLTDEEFIIAYYPDGEANSNIIKYGTLTFDGVKPDWKESGLRPFSDFSIGKISLKAGINHIVCATVNEKALGGTATSHAPLIDAIKLEIDKDSTVTLSMEPDPQSVKQIERLEDL